MQKNGIVARMSIRHKKAKMVRNTRGFAMNILDKNFSSNKPNQKWLSDTAFIHTRQGWLYLATLIDLYSRKMIGSSMAKNNNTDLVRDTLLMAVKKKPSNKR
jgi:putative transposase